jgi:hypothetical protein
MLILDEITLGPCLSHENFCCKCNGLNKLTVLMKETFTDDHGDVHEEPTVFQTTCLRCGHEDINSYGIWESLKGNN